MADLTGPNPDEVQGPDARDAVITAQPLLAGARAGATAPAAVSADGDSVDLWASRNGALNVILRDTAGTALPVAAALADATANPTLQSLGAFGFGYNGTTWDRLRTASGDALAATGLQAAGNMLWDTIDSDWDRQRSISADATANDGLAAAGLVGYNGSTYDRLRVIAGLDAAPNVDTGVLAVGMGPGWDRKQNPSNLGTAVNSAITIVVDGADVIVFAIGTGTTGTIIFETSADDSAWVASGSCLKIAPGQETWVPAAVTPTSGDVYMVRTTGVREVRVRTASTLGATVAVKWTASVGVAMVKAIDVGAAPHNVGYAITSKTAQYTTTQTGVALWTPASGKKVCILSYQIQVGGTTAGAVQLWYGASADTTYSRGTDLAIFDGEFAPSATNKPGIALAGVWPAGTADHILRVTDSAAINPLTITVWGYEFV